MQHCILTAVSRIVYLTCCMVFFVVTCMLYQTEPSFIHYSQNAHIAMHRNIFPQNILVILWLPVLLFCFKISICVA